MVSELMVPEGVLHMCICQFAHSRWLRGIEPEIKKTTRCKNRVVVGKKTSQSFCRLSEQNSYKELRNDRLSFFLFVTHVQLMQVMHRYMQRVSLYL